MGINTLFIRRAEWVPYEFTGAVMKKKEVAA